MEIGKVEVNRFRGTEREAEAAAIAAGEVNDRNLGGLIARHGGRLAATGKGVKH